MHTHVICMLLDYQMKAAIRCRVMLFHECMTVPGSINPDVDLNA